MTTFTIVRKLIYITAFLFSIQSTYYSQCYKLVWSDEFENGSLDLTSWEFGVGPSNDNVHYYTERPDNITIEDGKLKIIALSESYMGFDFTSGLIQTKNLFWNYGRIEARIKLTKSNGFVPAFWMMPAENMNGWWPNSGEIDIMEHPTNEVTKIYGTVHTQVHNSFGGTGPVGSNINIPSAQSEFHTYAIEWNENKIDFYVDENKYFTFSNDLKGVGTWPFDESFYIILNLAVGGGWVGNPNNETIFPAVMEVDYVRVYQNLNDIKIIGPDYVVVHDTEKKYSVADIDNTQYNWTLPFGANIVSGQNTSQIVVDWGDVGGNVNCSINLDTCSNLIEQFINVSNNYFANPGFEKGAKNWDKVVGHPANASFTVDKDDVHYGQNAIKVKTVKLGNNPWDIQLSQKNLTLEAGIDYEISFWAKALDGIGEINSTLINPFNFTVYTSRNISLADEWTEYILSYNPNSAIEASFNIDFGLNVGTYYIDDFKLTSPEINTTNKLLNHDFSNGDEFWGLTTLWPAVANGTVENGEYKVSIDNAGNNIWDIFLGQQDVLIENGKEYLVLFDARAVSDRTISAFTGKSSDPWTVYSGTNIFNLNSEKRSYTYSFKMNYEKDENTRVGFDIGGSLADLYFDNVYLTEITDTITSVSGEQIKQNIFELFQNYPNPSNPTTLITYSIPRRSRVILEIFDVLGRRIDTLVDEVKDPGYQQVIFNASGFSSGIYFYSIRTENFVDTKKMILLQ